MAEQIAYRGQARERGFNPIQLSTGRVEAILEQGAGLSRQLRENASIEESNRNRFSAGQEAAQRLEAANRSQNFELSQSAELAAQKATEQNLRTQINNAESAIRNQVPSQITPFFESLAKFSNTIATQISEYQKEKAEEELSQGYVDAYLGGPMPAEAALVEQGIQQIRAQDEIIQATADQMRDTGAQPQTVDAIRKLSGNRRLGQTLARADMAVAKWGPYLQQAYEEDNQTQIQFQDPSTGEISIITPMDAIGDDQKAAVNLVLLRRFLKEQGLMGLRPKFLMKTLQAMKEQENSLLDQERKLYEKAKDDERKSEVFIQLDAAMQAGGDRVGAMREAMRNLGHIRDEQGPVRPLRAFNMVLEHIVKNGDRDALIELENADSGDFGYQRGKTWGSLRQAEFQEARRKINTQRSADEDLEDKLESQRMEDWNDEVMATLYSIQGGAEVEQVDQLIEKSRIEFGKVDPRLTQYRENLTLQARDSEEAKANLDGLLQNNELTIEELDSGKYPIKLRFDPLYRRAAEEGSKKMEAIKKGLRDRFKEPITAALIQNADITGTINKEPPSFFFAEAHALSQLDKIALTYMRANKTPEEAYAQASRDIVAQIEKDREGPTGKKQYGPYSFNDGEFGLFSSKNNPKGQYAIAAKEVQNAVRTVRSGGTAAITQEKLIARHILEAANDPGSPIPPIAQVLANALPPGRSMSVYDIMNAQRALYGMPPRQPDYATTQIESTGNAKLRELINRMPTGARTSRAVVGAGLIGPGAERQAIRSIAQQLGVNPVDVATIINFETSGSLASGDFRRGLDIWGGDGGKYLGWIQFSPENQAKYGVRPGMTPDQMAQAVVKYFKDSGIRKGDGILELYQAVQKPAFVEQARRERRNISWDSNGMVSDHLKNMQRNHRGVAEAWLAGGQGGQSPYRDPRLMGATARKLTSVTMTSPRGPRWGQMHHGEDYDTPQGSRISTARGGVIEFVGNDPGGYGQFVDIRKPDGSLARFAHMLEIWMKPGDRVKPRQAFGRTGGKPGTRGAGRSTGPHLHLERRTGKGQGVSGPLGNLPNEIYIDI